MRVLVALGGNAMTGPDGSAAPHEQRRAIRRAMSHVADLVAAGHDVAITHGNGPQVGNILVKNELAAHVVPPVPLDWCGAQTQGTIGFTMLDALEGSLARRGVQRPVAAIVTRTLVDPDDPGFRKPTKPVGRYVSKDEAQPLIALGQVWEDRGAKGWRRVVASPEPLEVLDAHTLLTLMQAGYVVVAAGGADPRIADRSDHVVAFALPSGRTPPLCTASRRSSTRTSPRPCSPAPSTPMRSSSPRTSLTPSSVGARRRRGRSSA